MTLFPTLRTASPKTALRFGDRTLTHAELAATAGRLARQLIAQATARRPDDTAPVAVWATPTIETSVAVVAALLAGVPVVPVNPRTGERELTHIVADSDPVMVLAEPGVALPAALASLPRTDVDLVPEAGELPPEPGPEAPAVIVYTSGTTGPPKGAVLPRRAIAATLDALQDAWQWTADDVVVHALPLFHVHGLILGVLGPLRRGGTVVHLGRFSIDAVARELACAGTVLFGVPTMYHRIAEEVGDDPALARALAGARLLVSGSAALPLTDHQRITAATGRHVVERYGMTETLMNTSVRVDGEPRPGTVGGALPGVEVRLVDDSGRGSVGGRTGRLVEAAFRHAVEARLPVVSLIATGGSRMQEGMVALSQLQRMARAANDVREAGLPQVAVLCDPTTGGGWATLGAGADVTLALAGAQVGFAGSRVRPPGDDEAYTAQGQLRNGHVDQVLDPAELPAALGRWLALLTSSTDAPADVPAGLGAHDDLPATGFEAVRRARAARRPRAMSYLDSYFDYREAVSGDRRGGVDPGVLCGFGSRRGRTIAYAAQNGTSTRPSGYRTAARLIRLADRLGIPVLTLVDTPGAANDAAAERAGAGPAIAEVFGAVAAARVPVTTLVVGEGGSGGALALAAPGRTWITADAYFSVTAPEAAAAILKRGPDDVVATADQLRLRPQDVVALGIAESLAPRAP